MSTSEQKVQAIRPAQEITTLQRLPYFLGISGHTVGASGLSMHLVIIPPGAMAEPHIHIGYETGIYVLEGKVLTRELVASGIRSLFATQKFSDVFVYRQAMPGGIRLIINLREFPRVGTITFAGNLAGDR